MSEKSIDATKELLELVSKSVMDIAKEKDLRFVIAIHDQKTRFGVERQFIEDDFFPSAIARLIVTRCEEEKITTKAMLKKIKKCVDITYEQLRWLKK